MAKRKKKTIGKKQKRALAGGPPANKEIRILQDGNVDLDDCPVSKKGKDKVRWVSEYGPWTVTFADNPFDGPGTFKVAAGKKSNWSDDAIGAERTCKYTVTGNGIVVDPNIIVKG
jgi:hypothetical protein